MAKRFTTPVGEPMPGAGVQSFLQQNLLLSKKRTHDYRQWSDRATVIGYSPNTRTYRISMSQGGNLVDDTRVFDNVRALQNETIIPSGATVMIGYDQERREQPVILGLGTNRKLITDDDTTPKSPHIQFPDSDADLYDGICDYKNQVGDYTIQDYLGQTCAECCACTRTVHCVGGRGHISWTWSYDGSDRIFHPYGLNNFRLLYGVSSGGAAVYTGETYIVKTYCAVLHDLSVSTYRYACQVTVETASGHPLPLTAGGCAEGVHVFPGPNTNMSANSDFFGQAMATLLMQNTVVLPYNGIAGVTLAGDCTDSEVYDINSYDATIGMIDGLTFSEFMATRVTPHTTSTGTLPPYSCEGSACVNADGSTLTATDADGNSVSVVVSVH